MKLRIILRILFIFNGQYPLGTQTAFGILLWLFCYLTAFVNLSVALWWSFVTPWCVWNHGSSGTMRLLLHPPIGWFVGPLLASSAYLLVKKATLKDTKSVGWFSVGWSVGRSVRNHFRNKEPPLCVVKSIKQGQLDCPPFRLSFIQRAQEAPGSLVGLMSLESDFSEAPFRVFSF